MPQRHAPATARNREAILRVLQDVLPKAGCILEIASGSGEHAVYFAPRLAPRMWLPSDIDPDNLASIEAWSLAEPCHHLLQAINLDACEYPWAIESAPIANCISAVVNINMIHIAPWEACIGLFKGAARVLAAGGVVFLYGPFARQGKHTADSNAHFDRQLRARNSQWGVRDLDEVTVIAEDMGFRLSDVVEMPANNLSVVFSRR